MTERLRDPRLPLLLLGLGVVASGAMLVAFGSKLSFFLDEWDFILHRPGFTAEAILNPHNEHISVVPVLAYKALLGTFGLQSPLPFQVAAILAYLSSVVLVFVFIRSRLGGWLALAAVLPLLVLGGAWEDLLSPFQIALSVSMCGGVGALLALEHETRRHDAVATALLTLSVLSSSLGIAFVAGIGLWLLIDDARRRRLFVAVVPGAVFVLWWLGWGREAENFLSFNNLATSPSFILDGFAASIATLLGLATPRDEIEVSALNLGRPLLVAAVGLAALRLRSVAKVPDGLLVVVAIALAFWLLTALNASLYRYPITPRYQYMGVIFVLLIAAELMRGTRLPWRALIAIYLVAIAAAASNFSYLHQAWEDFSAQIANQRGGLTALEISRDNVASEFLLTPENSDAAFFDYVDAGSYLAAVDNYGSPAYSLDELAAAPEAVRVAADKAMAGASRIGLRSGPVQAQLPLCREARLSASAPTVLELPAGGVSLRTRNQTQAELALRRYASQSFPFAAGALGPRETATLEIPPDRSSKPWQLELSGSGLVDICDLKT